MQHRSAKRLLAMATVTAVGAAGLTACSGVFDQRHRTVSYGVHETVHALVVKGGTGDVHVTGGSGPVQVTERQNYHDTPPNATHTTTDGTLTLAYSGRDTAIDYDVRVPAGTVVTITDDTGDIRVAGISGAVRATTDTGSVTGSGLTSRQVELVSDTGDVTARLDAVPDRVSAGSGTGKVDLKVPGNASYAVTATAGTGKARVEVPQATGSRHTISAKAGTGDVTVSAG
ncbi:MULTISPECIES: DUF4097 family beta strand repeat-containing protein [Streptomycetaceae]|uniref:DUF4097 domain-containing protein n=1 Tax=Streptantibioticus cattleyicolor (strain ATCC 35852 / DSM 46488 / JCM 4925 / NBRC 14057 / NRRL 8057) TaxID=1003195 RepID=F8JRN6_STREN|nr:MULTISPECIES: DUF4097 family beta strand repeat-containing protein [Streptomycetaceae]AEW97925.1 hypothetical protein SCATT_55540 [Streptantibioticus cattleyicolor NRRL 8057 = DSM 46488]MYS62330.1 DUF4097 family beta strand repeat protein [Streptomyces sp. SID5468]CCB78241.1 conserved exported protein of unknown function [Streptantibioticus cattleyicolor NRRL 8057 = DSM 46488]